MNGETERNEMGGETERKGTPKVVRKTNRLFTWLGGIALVPIIGLLGNLVIGTFKEYMAEQDKIKERLTTVEDTTSSKETQNNLAQRIAIIEANSSSKKAIWEAITRNQENHENEKDLLLEKMHAMSVKYQAAMLVFEKHFIKGGCATGRPMAKGNGHGDLETTTILLETLQKILKEVQKAESADQEEIKKLHKELDKMKEQQTKLAEEEKQQAALLEALKKPRVPNAPKKFDASKIRQQYEEKFPRAQQQLQEQLQQQAPIKK